MATLTVASSPGTAEICSHGPKSLGCASRLAQLVMNDFLLIYRYRALYLRIEGSLRPLQMHGVAVHVGEVAA